MKKLDKLILKSFLGPFILTFLVAVFILLIQYMLKYFDDFIGKDLGFMVFGELMMYFSVNMVPMALPLAILISSLMTYGQLGEHFELTAIKSAGIALPRVLLPTFVFVIFVAIAAFFINNDIVPQANLRAYSLLYDIKQQKPALDLRAGQFYGGIPEYSIYIKEKYPDGVAMSDIVIYDHTNSNGNQKVILADSCRMYTFNNDRYLMMELYDGNHYVEEENSSSRKKDVPQLVRTNFHRMDIIFSLESFNLDRTDMDLFASNRYMKSVSLLEESIDSMRLDQSEVQFKLYNSIGTSYRMIMGGFVEAPEELIAEQVARDSLRQARKNKDSLSVDENKKELIDLTDSIPPSARPLTHDNRSAASGLVGKPEHVTESSVSSTITFMENKRQKKIKNDSLFLSSVDLDSIKVEMDSLFVDGKKNKQAFAKALSNARGIKTTINSSINRKDYFKKSIDAHTVEKYKKYAQSCACIIMFLIGAPLGAIIKRGGLGLPIIVGVIFFIIFYVFTSASDKWAKGGILDGMLAAWVANMILLPFGVLFLIQAWKDAKLFDTDFYSVAWDRAVSAWKERGSFLSKFSFRRS